MFNKVSTETVPCKVFYKREEMILELPEGSLVQESDKVFQYPVIL